MGNSYQKKDYRLYSTAGLVLASQVEGLADDALPRYHNCKIYREGAIGMRDQRDWFAGVPRKDGIPGWITGLTRLDTTYLLAFIGGSVYGWKRPVPGAGLTAADVADPKTAVAVSFENFLPTAGVSTWVTVLPDERANPTVYFTKPAVERMWKIYALGSKASGVTRRVVTGTGATTDGMSSADADSFLDGNSLSDHGVIQAPTLNPLAVSFWGLNAPTGRPTGVAYHDAAGKLSSRPAGTFEYDWVWTHVNSTTGSESNPSAGLETLLDVDPGPGGAGNNAVRLECPVNTGGDPQIDRIRLYRKGGSLTDYHLHSEIELHRERGVVTGPYAPQTITVTDTKSDDDIKTNPILRLDNFVPFISTSTAGDSVWNAVCPFVFGPFNPGNVILGIGEENKRGTVFWTNPGRPDTTGPLNNVDVTSSGDPLISGCVFNGIPFVASRGSWYALDPQQLGSGVQDLAFVPRKTNVGRGPVAPWAITTGDFIFFLNSEGVFATDGQNAAMEISQGLRPIFHGETCGEYKPVKWDAPQEMLRLYWTGPELHFIYPDTDSVMRHLIYDGSKWRSEEFARGRYQTGGPTSPDQAALTAGTYPWDAAEPYLHTTAVFNDIAWPERQILLGTDQSAAFITRPYVSSGWEMSDFVYNGGTGDPESNSYYGWVLGHFRTKTDDMEMPALLKKLGDVSFEASGKWTDDDYAGRAKLTLYATAEGGTSLIDNGTERLTANVPIGSTIYNAATTGRARYVFPVEDDFVYSSAWDFQFCGKWQFHNLSLFFFPRTEVVRHWQLDNTNHNINGWQHVRDGYIDAVLYGTATLTLQVDAEPSKAQTVTISPLVTRGDGTIDDLTGERFKYYFSLYPVKGKKFTWTLDCSAGMQIYGEDCEVNGKKWITSTGYQNVNPLVIR